MLRITSLIFTDLLTLVLLLFISNVGTARNVDSSLVVWINATYKAEDAGLNLTTLCLPYEQYWKLKKASNCHENENFNSSISTDSILNITLSNNTVAFDNDSFVDLSEPEPILFIQNISVAEKLGFNVIKYNDYNGTLAINFGQVCQMFPRVLWINDSATATRYHLNTSVICLPFRHDHDSFNKSEISQLLDVSNITSDVNHTLTGADSNKQRQGFYEHVVATTSISIDIEHLTDVSFKVESNITENDPILYILTIDRAAKLNLESGLFQKHQSLAIYLPGACEIPDTEGLVKTFNASEFGVDVQENIGINVEKLKESHNITELEETLANDTEVHSINTNNETEVGIRGGSFILPILAKQLYDANSHPTAFKRNLSTEINFGIHIESLANFQTDTMDYDMDAYLIMSWRDARLSHNFGEPILVKEEEIRDKIWRPDPYFANAKEASFQEVMFPNFLLKIFPTGKVLYEVRVKLKPTCNLVLCKFPHDSQQCSLVIRSFAYPADVVTFRWFESEDEAIKLNPEISLPELYITQKTPASCDGSRVTGNFSCIKAVFSMKRDVGFHAARTYVPTTLALMFSWVGVWLPEHMTEPRIGIAITVLLTLSTESAGASDHLPNVSYTKAIDVWFEVITSFVFFTLLQTLLIIGFDRKAKTLLKYANRKTEGDQAAKEKYLLLANRYHKASIYFDIACRLLYPMVFVCFLMFYFFVITQGSQDDCVKRK